MGNVSIWVLLARRLSAVGVLAIFLQLSAAAAADGYEPGKFWDIRIVDSDHHGPAPGEYLNLIKDNKEFPEWGADLPLVVGRLSALEVGGDAWRSLFVDADSREAAELSRWVAEMSAFWRQLDVLAMGRSKINPKLAFAAVATADEGGLPVGFYDKYDEETGTRIVKGGGRVVFFRMDDQGSWKIDARYSDSQLAAIMDEEVFISRQGWGINFDRDFVRQLRERRERRRSSERIAEMEREELEWFLRSHKDDYPRKDLIRKFKLIYEMNDSVQDLLEAKTRVEGFRIKLKKRHIRVLEKPVLIPDAAAPLEDGLSDGNPLDYIRKFNHSRYTAPDRLVELPKGSFMSPNRWREYPERTIQITHYTTGRFDGADYLLIGYQIFKAENPREDRILECGNSFTRYDGEPLYSPISERDMRIKTGIRIFNNSFRFVLERNVPTPDIGAVFEDRLKKAGLYPLFRIHPLEDCVLFEPGMDIESLPTLRIDDDSFSEPIP